MGEQPSRRQFIKQTTLGTTVLVVIQQTSAWVGGDQAQGQHSKTLGNSWIDAHGKAVYRFDGPAKVLGSKVYGRDFRAKDLVGWPQTEGFAHILRATKCDRPFLRLNSSALRDKLGCDPIITSGDLAPWNLKAPLPYWTPSPFVSIGGHPLYFGQPLAILFFRDLAAYRKAKPLLADLNSLNSFVQYGASSSPVADPRPPFGTSKFVNYLGDTGAAAKNADDLANKIRQELTFDPKKESTGSSLNKNWRIYQRSFETQSVDPMFMEPECGLGWYDSKTKKLSLTYGTQSPQDDLDGILSLLSGENAPKITKIQLNVCQPGGGFGGRDLSEFPILLALASVLQPDTTQRIVYSRSDQFQAGLKRHASQCALTLAVNQTPERFGKLEAIHSTTLLDGGGQNNYSFAVQNVGARNMTGAYDFARSLVESEARPSQSVPAGSMRGYGSLQAQFALECLVDEIASDLKLDPVDFRLKNLVPDHKPMHTGVVPAHKIPSRRVLEKIQESSLWKNRHNDQLQKSTADKLYGVGMALAVKSYGKSPGDTCLASITIAEEGAITLSTHSVDMGNGTATTLPLALFDILGRAADAVIMGDTDHFTPLSLEGPKAKDQIDQDRLAKNPRWVPSRSMSTAASAGAYQMRHPVVEAAKIIFQFSIWPAARALWGIPSSTQTEVPKEVLWKKGLLTYQGYRPLTWNELVKHIYKVDGITGVMVHSFYRSQWAQGTFSLVMAESTPSSPPKDSDKTAKQRSIQIPIDALALKNGKHSYQVVDRQGVEFPPFATLMQGANRYTPYGLVVAVEVQRSAGPQQGAIKIVAAEGYLECGTVIQQDIVEGQMEGAFAMGIGQTLLEDFAPAPDGPGQGGWNLHRYQVPLARHCALSQTKFTTLNAEPNEDPKGMAEVVLNAVPPAIANAIAHATGSRIRKLPVSAEDLKKGLL